MWSMLQIHLFLNDAIEFEDVNNSINTTQDISFDQILLFPMCLKCRQTPALKNLYSRLKKLLILQDMTQIKGWNFEISASLAFFSNSVLSLILELLENVKTCVGPLPIFNQNSQRDDMFKTITHRVFYWLILAVFYTNVYCEAILVSAY